LVDAEIAGLEGRNFEAMRLYEQAIHSARDNGFVHNQAIAYERASAFYHARGFDQFADAYLCNARLCYLHWGAIAKVRQLESLYPSLAAAEGYPRAETVDAIEKLDVTTVVKAAQAVSGETELAKLIERLMTVALENAGANRGLLISPRGDDYFVEAVAEVADGNIVVHQEPLPGSAAPASLIRYVVRTRESVILDDPRRSNQFAGDEYLVRRQPCSVFCLPLVRQSAVAGVLYL
jgi:GAF domain-containing protein